MPPSPCPNKNKGDKMKPFFSLFFLASLLLSFASFSHATLDVSILGGYQPINVNDPIVSEIAQFAVSKHNSASNSKLRVIRVIKAEKQIVAGTNYRLELEAGDGGIVRRYETVVYQNLAGVRELTYFNPVKTIIADAPLLGGYQPINVHDPIVSEIAQFAVSKHNSASNSKLRVIRVIKAEKQIVAGTNYRLELEAGDGGIVGRYETVVYQNLAGVRELTYFNPVKTIIADAPLLGGYQPINVHDPIVSEIAQFAVSKHNSATNSKLRVIRVIKAEEQIVAGRNYRLVLEAGDGGIVRRYETVVYQNLAGVRELTYFNPVKTIIADTSLPGGYQPINVHDPIVSEIAQFAVSKHNSASNSKLRVIRVIKAEEQIVAGRNYRLVLEATDGERVGTYETVVYQSLAGVRELKSFIPLLKV